MANLTSNSLFIASGVLFVVGLLFVAYPYLTLTAAALCGIIHISYYHSSVLVNYYTNFTSVLWPALSGNERQPPHSPNLLTGIDLPSPIPHVPSGLETAKNRRSPVDEIVSSTPRSTPNSSHGASGPVTMPLPSRVSPEMIVSDSRQLNFGRINTPKTSRNQAQDFLLNHTTFNKVRNRAPSGKMIQTTAGPLLSSGRHNPTFDAGSLFVNVNSPGFTDRLVRCANDNSGLSWGHNNPATQQDRYGSVGLFPIVHLNTSPPPSLTSRNSQKLPNSSVRVKIAPPVSSDQRLQNNRSNMQMRPYISVRKNEIAKSVLESLQEASRKRIYSQCQEVMEDDPGKKRQRKGETALPNPNCDIHQYRHIRAPSVPTSSTALGSQNDIQSHGKRLHDDPSRANEAKRLRHHLRPQSSNNEISSSLSSSKTLLQRLSGNKRKADCYDFGEDGKGKHFKESASDSSSPSTSRWLHSQTCEAGESAARTQEVLRNRKKLQDTSSISPKKVAQKNTSIIESATVSALHKKTHPTEETEVISEKVADKSENDLTSKLFRKDVVARSHPKAIQPDKRGSSWSQVPPVADERCLSEQGSSSDLDRPERFQSLLSRMSGQDIRTLKPSGDKPKALENHSNNDISNLSPDLEETDSVKVTSTVVSSSSFAVVSAPSPTPASISSFSSMTNPSPEEGTKETTTTPAPVPSSVTSLTSLISVKPTPGESPITTPATSATASTLVNFNSSGKEEQTAPSPAAKPMFTFTPSNSQATLRPVSSQAASPTASPMISFAGITQPMFQITAPQKSVSDTANLKSTNFSLADVSNQKTSLSLPAMSSNQLQSTISPPDSLKPPAPFQTGFSFLPQANITSVADNSSKSTVTTLDKTVKFIEPGQKPQFSAGSFSPSSHQQPQLNGPSGNSAQVASSGTFSASTLSQPSVSATNSADKKSFGGFSFSSTSGSIFGGQPNASNDAPTTASFSFTPASAMPVISTSAKNISESKSVGGSGSITFGTVSTSVAPPTSAMAFNFSSPATASSVTETAVKTTFQLSNNSSMINSNSASSGFTTTSQGLFNGLTSIQNPSTSATSFGVLKLNQQQQQPPPSNQQPSTQQPSNQQLQSQQQTQSPGGFSFGSSLSSATSTSLPFGTVAPASGTVFGEGSSQPPAFGSASTTGFSLQTSVPSFKSSPFTSATASSGISFGSSQQSSISNNLFGGQAVPSSPSAFGLLSSFNGNSAPSASSTFGASAVPTFGASAPVEATFGAASTTVPVSTITSPFAFGATSSEKPQAPTFNFGASSPSSPPAFNFGSNDQSQQNTSNSLFQFGQQANSNAAPAFQFGSPSAQPGGSGGFSMGTGPPTPQRTSRALSSRRRRI